MWLFTCRNHTCAVFHFGNDKLSVKDWTDIILLTMNSFVRFGSLHLKILKHYNICTSLFQYFIGLRRDHHRTETILTCVLRHDIVSLLWNGCFTYEWHILRRRARKMANQMFQTNTGTTENFTVVFTGSDSCAYFRYGRERLFGSTWFSGIGLPSSKKRPVFTGINTSMPLWLCPVLKACSGKEHPRANTDW